MEGKNPSTHEGPIRPCNLFASGEIARIQARSIKAFCSSEPSMIFVQRLRGDYFTFSPQAVNVSQVHGNSFEPHRLTLTYGANLENIRRLIVRFGADRSSSTAVAVTTVTNHGHNRSTCKGRYSDMHIGPRLISASSSALTTLQAMNSKCAVEILYAIYAPS